MLVIDLFLIVQRPLQGCATYQSDWCEWHLVRVESKPLRVASRLLKGLPPGCRNIRGISLHGVQHSLEQRGCTAYQSALEPHGQRWSAGQGGRSSVVQGMLHTAWSLMCNLQKDSLEQLCMLSKVQAFDQRLTTASRQS